MKSTFINIACNHRATRGRKRSVRISVRSKIGKTNTFQVHAKRRFFSVLTLNPYVENTLCKYQHLHHSWLAATYIHIYTNETFLSTSSLYAIRFLIASFSATINNIIQTHDIIISKYIRNISTIRILAFYRGGNSKNFRSIYAAGSRVSEGTQLADTWQKSSRLRSCRGTQSALELRALYFVSCAIATEKCAHSFSRLGFFRNRAYRVYVRSGQETISHTIPSSLRFAGTKSRPFPRVSHRTIRIEEN